MTQISEAKQGIITKEIRDVSKSEKLSLNMIRKDRAEFTRHSFIINSSFALVIK